ncbi:hypothetical protein COCSUDRAFT_41624 [Coccomyxa subellipsoidea C-169]|uniref:Uncharacterized protein n=1 Tax=Coccomyxa subellipsoidea (strain C-169) TaxID=574566 RepID=I0YY93_COCSC|nr:hypothetical protein COCSUDRAFT_41624 [Coccomyxa subellipsoidea C-169]EIE23362.1 hypothetical protein COCSUDRAFT_41624 [Coccomyxa subellipsoidea C-169]|eukprot:XP_005647906.1 hypothetical protein COCSUDRAFT_41624 [Coccomyxa subellipsoidea C-169]
MCRYIVCALLLAAACMPDVGAGNRLTPRARQVLQASDGTTSAAYLASSKASDAAQPPDSNLGRRLQQGTPANTGTPSDAYGTTTGKQGKSGGAPFSATAPAPSMTMAYQTNQGKQGQGILGTAESGLSAGDRGSQTIGSTGNDGVSGTGASGSGASADQSCANGASIAPAPAS